MEIVRCWRSEESRKLILNPVIHHILTSGIREQHGILTLMMVKPKNHFVDEYHQKLIPSFQPVDAIIFLA